MQLLSSKGLDIIKRYESFSPIVYLCPANVWTIGYGHAIFSKKEHEDWLAKQPVTEEEALALLAQDTKKAELTVTHLTKVPLSQGQYDALVSFTFNVGGGAYQRSTLRQKLNRLEYTSASSEFPRWNKANGKVLKGLVKRRREEQVLFTL